MEILIPTNHSRITVSMSFSISCSFHFPFNSPLNTAHGILGELKNLSHSATEGFPKLGVPFLGVPIIRTIVFWGLYWGSPILGKYQQDIIPGVLGPKP